MFWRSGAVETKRLTEFGLASSRVRCIHRVICSGDQNPKRKKMMDDSVASDSDGESGPHHGGQVTAKLQRLNEEEEPVRKSSAPAKNPERLFGGEKEREGRAEDERKGDDLQKDLPCSDLIVLGLPYKFSEKELRAYFEKFGKVVLCEVRLFFLGEWSGVPCSSVALVDPLPSDQAQSEWRVQGIRVCADG